MRLIPISAAAALAMLTAAAPLSAQQVSGHHGGRPMPGHHHRMGGYIPPVKGYVLPRYWVAPQFVIHDWRRYRFSAPPRGHNWVRYYDDAVLVDRDGRVSDAVRGVEWSGHHASRDGYYDRYAPRERRDSNVEGAVAGAVVGGVAGNLIAGRGNRLGGTLIGAGVGALAGAAIDAAENSGQGAPYDQPGYPDGRMVPPSHGDYYGPASDGFADGYDMDGPPPPDCCAPRHGEWRYGGEVFGPIGAKRTRILHEGYVEGGWYYPPVIETQMVVGVPGERQHAPVVVEERTYRKAAPHPVKRVYRSKGK